MTWNPGRGTVLAVQPDPPGRFEQDARAAAALRHPELLEGSSLADRLREQRRDLT
jgi:hypothetical protein